MPNGTYTIDDIRENTPQPILDAKDILTGSLGRLVMVLPGGKEMTVMHAKNIEASVSYEKEQVAILGKRGKGNRKTGETYSGSMTIYYVDSTYRDIAQFYKNHGKDTYFDLVIYNNDTNSHAGEQLIILRDCNFDEMVLGKLDADAAILEEDISFTFEDWVLDTKFTPLDGLFDDGTPYDPEIVEYL